MAEPAKNSDKEEPIKQQRPLSSTSTLEDKRAHRKMMIAKSVEEYFHRVRDMPISEATIFKYWSSEDEDMDPSQYYEKRLKTLAAQKAAGKELYRNTFKVSISNPEFLNKYENLKTDQHMEDAIECLAGRVMNKLSSSELITYDLVGSGGQVQVFAFPKLADMDMDTFFKLHSDLKNGDYIGVIGFPGKSCMGELGIIPKTIKILAYCLHKLPYTHYNVKKTDVQTPRSGRYPDTYISKDQEIHHRQRFLDLTINSKIKDICKTRTQVVSYIRHFLENIGFLEVETPTLTMVPAGAATRTFVTHRDDLNMKMFMRSEPERYLKQLVGGGIERVYEIGKQFRNEGIDLMHNPEVTTCEFYMALAGYKDLMELTEQILSGMVKELTGGYKVTYHANGYDNPPIEIDCTPPFRRISMIEELEKMANLSIPKDLASDEARQYLADACIKFDISCPPPQTTTRLLEKLVEHFLEVTCVNPTFIIDHPEITSPLAKAHQDKPGMTERFMLFINKLEIVNAYIVENDPVVQRQRFSNQLKDRRSGDEESIALDETFYTALEYGIPPTAGCVLENDPVVQLQRFSNQLKDRQSGDEEAIALDGALYTPLEQGIPPTAGWVLDIDTLTMLLTDSLSIKEVILFPAMKRQPLYEPPIKGETVTTGVNYDVENNTSTTTSYCAGSSCRI